jgi:polyisoprenoid-binding protein YceI
MTDTDGHPPATRAPEADPADSVLEGPSTWTLDPARSSAALRSKSVWGLVTVRGSFGELTGHAEILPGGAARGRLEIGAASLDTKNAKRDRHLASADFFNAAEHPSIVADLASATRTGDRAPVRHGFPPGARG